VASRDGEVSLLNAVIRELAAEKMATLAAMRELLSGHDRLYCAHFGAACNPADDIAAKAARRILDEAKAKEKPRTHTGDTGPEGSSVGSYRPVIVAHPR
jgi:hypothetical protein